MKESTSHSRVVLPLHEQGIAIYSRKSRFTGKGESVGNQIELCRQYLSCFFINYIYYNI